MSVMTPRRLEQLRRRAQQEGCGNATQDYIIGLKMQGMELTELAYRLAASEEKVRRELIEVQCKLIEANNQLLLHSSTIYKGD